MPKKLTTAITPEHLEGIARHVEEFAANCRAVAVTMRHDHLAEIEVAAWQQTGASVVRLDAFVKALRDGLAMARESKGEMPPLPAHARAKPRNGVPDSHKKRTTK